MKPIYELDDTCSQECRDACPSSIRESIDAYVMYGRPMGDFLQSVFANDLMLAVGRADNDNVRKLREICQYIYNAVPSALYGNRMAYDLHVKACEEVRREERQQQEKNDALLAIAKRLRKTMPCHCDLDRWEPERDTGHSWVCGIHKSAVAAYQDGVRE